VPRAAVRLRQGFAGPSFEATSPVQTPKQTLRTTPFGCAISVQRAGAAPNNHLGACPRARRGVREVFREGKRAFEKPVLAARVNGVVTSLLQPAAVQLTPPRKLQRWNRARD
jgi:hypothetical protein